MSVIDENMLAFGSCIVGFGILVTALLALLFRHPNAPRWTRPEIVVMLVCVAVTATTGVGLGYTAYGLSQLANGTGRSERTPGAPGGADRPRHALARVTDQTAAEGLCRCHRRDRPARLPAGRAHTRQRRGAAPAPPAAHALQL